MQTENIKANNTHVSTTDTQSQPRKKDRSKNQRRYKRLMSLDKGKIKNIGMIEGLRLKMAGNSDGARGFPRSMDDGHWRSAFIDKEVNAYEEFCSRMWGSLQIEVESIFTRIGELIDSINHLWAELDKEKERLSEQSKDDHSLSVRKKGEERLTESQIKSRRKRERNKRLAPTRSRISSLDSRIAVQIDEFLELKNMVDEESNTTRMICNRLKDHTLQRIDVYWSYALRKHPDVMKMPTVPHVDLSYNAEKVYMTPHLELIQKADKLIQLISEQNKED